MLEIIVPEVIAIAANAGIRYGAQLKDQHTLSVNLKKIIHEDRESPFFRSIDALTKAFASHSANDEEPKIKQFLESLNKNHDLCEKMLFAGLNRSKNPQIPQDFTALYAQNGSLGEETAETPWKKLSWALACLVLHPDPTLQTHFVAFE